MWSEEFRALRWYSSRIRQLGCLSFLTPLPWQEMSAQICKGYGVAQLCNDGSGAQTLEMHCENECSLTDQTKRRGEKKKKKETKIRYCCEVLMVTASSFTVCWYSHFQLAVWYSPSCWERKNVCERGREKKHARGALSAWPWGTHNLLPLSGQHLCQALTHNRQRRLLQTNVDPVS